MRIAALMALALSGVSLAGCHTPENPAIPVGQAAYDVIPVDAPQAALDRMVRLRAGDTVSLSVAGEPDLKLEDVAVSESGTLQVPLAGEVAAAGLTTGELGAAIAGKLSAYLRNPQVAVNISKPVVRTVSVEGEVDEAGIYPITRETTLLGALALARSPTTLAKHDDIFIFRKIDGQQMGARFDLYQLRNGLAPDPQILPDDVVVVGRSRSRAAFEDFLRAAPALNVFTLLSARNNGN
jgi:polysaccharide export outer membrane protein